MGKYTAISDVGNALVALLRESLVPDTIQNPDGISLCSPGDRGEAALCVHLYDLRESDEIRGTDMVDLEPDRQRFPPTYLSLFYMFTAFSAADVKFRAAEEQRILGKVIQTLGDNGALSAETLRPLDRGAGPVLRLRMLPLETEERMRLWPIPNSPCKLSLFYRVSPVALESARMRSIRRVVDSEMALREYRHEEA